MLPWSFRFHLEGRSDNSHMHSKVWGLTKNKFLDEGCISKHIHAVVHGVANSRRWLSDWTTWFTFEAMTMHLCREAPCLKLRFVSSGLDFFILIADWISYIASEELIQKNFWFKREQILVCWFDLKCTWMSLLSHREVYVALFLGVECNNHKISSLNLP